MENIKWHITVGLKLSLLMKTKYTNKKTILHYLKSHHKHEIIQFIYKIVKRLYMYFISVGVPVLDQHLK